MLVIVVPFLYNLYKAPRRIRRQELLRLYTATHEAYEFLEPLVAVNPENLRTPHFQPDSTGVPVQNAFLLNAKRLLADLI